MSKQKDNASEDASRIAGNVSLDLKEFIALQFKDIMANKTGIGFAQSVGMKFALMEISWLKKPEEPERMEARVVMEGIVDDGKQCLRLLRTSLIFVMSQDMANSWGNLHGGCTAYLADM
jgi:acyl-coenzyme A thioesterase 13